MSQQQSEDSRRGSFLETRSRIFNYHQALKRLKKVSGEITLMKSRINILDHKKVREEPVLANPRGTHEERLREEGRVMNETLRRQLAAVKDRSLSENRQRQMKNHTQRKMNGERVDRARRAITEEKFQAHNRIKEMTAMNQIKVKREKDERLMERRIRSMKMRKEEERSLQAIRSLKQTRLTQIHRSFEEDTGRLIEQTRAREKALRSLQGDCYSKQSLSVTRSPYQKVRKLVYAKKTPTTQTHPTGEEENSRMEGLSARSTFDFVVLQ